MKLSRFPVLRPLRSLLGHQAGSTLIVTAAVIPVLLGVAGLSVDAGRAYAAKRALSSETQAAAFAGAYALAAVGATSSSVTTAVSNWNTANPVSNVTITNSSTTLSCVTSTSNLPSCNSTNPNVVTVSQTGTVSTYFLKALGRSSFTIASTASAAKAGGTAQALNVMFVLDATGSMSTVDSGCQIPNPAKSGTYLSNVTRFQCAQYSVQSILKVMSPSLDKVGLMIFPGMGSQYSPTSHPCATQPNSVPYLSSTIYYQIGTSLDTTYNDGSGNLVNTSPMIQAIGNGVGTSATVAGCVTNKGGEGSYGAEVITKAAAALPVQTGVKNVIIFMSDGDYGATSAQLNNQSSKTSKQCGQAVTAATNATTGGTTVYAVAYGAPTSGCSSGDTYNPCTAMQAIASDSTKFYSTDATCQITNSANQISQLPSVFSAIGTTLTKPRLVLK